MSIREELHYRPVCDRCGAEWATFGTRAEAEQLPRGWIHDGDRHICEGCLNVDRQAACSRETGHLWDITYPEPFECTGAYRTFQMRYCELCERHERRDCGEDWFGYDSRGRWLGDKKPAP